MIQNPHQVPKKTQSTNVAPGRKSSGQNVSQSSKKKKFSRDKPRRWIFTYFIPLFNSEFISYSPDEWINNCKSDPYVKVLLGSTARGRSDLVINDLNPVRDEILHST
ncbi:unnamed protein product [Rhizophagus irregularis]|nr:unnamed protein product [Rhizophagus irregularis]